MDSCLIDTLLALMENTMKMPVSLRALSERINRKLRKENKKLMKNPSRLHSGYGQYSIIDMNLNVIDSYHVEIEKLAKELGCLADYEEITQ